MFDLLLYNANILTFNNDYTDFNLIHNGIVGIKDGLIKLVTDKFENYDAESKIDVENKWIFPGFIDCHTHFIYGGNRAHEFQDILEGKSYQDIAKQGGGIKYTVKKTRDISFKDLLEVSKKRLNNFIYNNGVTTVEVKSGYGLDLDTELKMLQVAQKLELESKIDIYKTYLGAHVTPEEYLGDSDNYINFIIKSVIPKLAELGVINFIDVFCESIAFNKSQTEKIFKAAGKFNFKLKCHADQLSNTGIADLSRQYKILSLDHLEYSNENDIKQMSENDVTAVLLPGAFYYLKENKKPPISSFRKHKVPFAIATDCNPGSSPCESLLTIMNMSCVLYSLTIFEAIKAVTINAAKALGISNIVGSIEIGKKADLVVWDIESPAELCYKIGAYKPDLIIKDGVQL